MKRLILHGFWRWTSGAAVAVATSITWAAPSHALIVDVDATANNTDNPVLLFLAAGTYSVTPVGIAGGGIYDGWNPWGVTTCGNPAGCPQTHPTTVIGWKTSYNVVSDAIAAVSVNGSPLAPVGAEVIEDYWLVSGSETDRYQVDNDTVYPSGADALTGAESSEFVVSTSGFVGFAIRDASVSDNLGGMSLEVLPVPEPSAGALVGVGMALLAMRRRTGRVAGR
jgi:hypothetical protein